MNISLYIHTIRYLKGKQIFYQIWYRLQKIVKKKKPPFTKVPPNSPLTLTHFINKPKTLTFESTFCFLNIIDTIQNWQHKEAEVNSME